MAVKSGGREQRKGTATAQARTPNLSHFYRYKLPPIHPGDYTFELTLLRPRRPPFVIKGVDTLSWDDEQSILTGNFTAYRPDADDPSSLPVEHGHLIRCRVKWGSRTYTLWTMRAAAPQYEADTGNLSVDLKDDLARVDTGRRDWWFRKTKHRPFGYRADEIAQEVGRRLRIKVRTAARGSYRFELKMRNATGLDVLKRAYLNEQQRTGLSYVIRLVNGAIEITRIRRNTTAYVLGPEAQTLLLTLKGGAQIPFTVLTGRGHIGSGKSAKHITYTLWNRKLERLYGYSHDTHDYGKVSSHSDLRNQVKRDLAKGLALTGTVTLLGQGIPFIRRGDSVKIDLPLEGFTGEQAFMFCTRASHSVQAGIYTTQWDLNRTDAYKQLLSAQAKAVKARAKARAKRNRPKLKH